LSKVFRLKALKPFSSNKLFQKSLPPPNSRTGVSPVYFSVIGEATKALPENLKEKYPEIPWKEMSGFRDKLIHFYFGIKYELVWQAIKNRLPQLKLSIQNILLKS
jgi:uncharacterized protein with HEPN domain